MPWRPERWAVTDIPIVFMANDRFADWALPFLRSLRATNPDVRLWCIPYADDLAVLRDAAAAFDFRFLDADYAAIDVFAATHFPKDPYKRRRLRKLAAFDLERFLYLDCDVLVLRPLAPALAATAGTRGLVYFSCSPEWVYAAAAGPEVAMRFGEQPRFSTGAFLARNTGMDASGWLAALREETALWRRLRAPWVVDQPAINLVCHQRRLPLTDFDALAPGLTGRGFAADPSLLAVPDGGLTRLGRSVMWVHWAGAAKDRVAPELATLAARFGLPIAA